MLSTVRALLPAVALLLVTTACLPRSTLEIPSHPEGTQSVLVMVLPAGVETPSQEEVKLYALSIESFGALALESGSTATFAFYRNSLEDLGLVEGPIVARERPAPRSALEYATTVMGDDLAETRMMTSTERALMKIPLIDWNACLKERRCVRRSLDVDSSSLQDHPLNDFICGACPPEPEIAPPEPIMEPAAPSLTRTAPCAFDDQATIDDHVICTGAQEEETCVPPSVDYPQTPGCQAFDAPCAARFPVEAAGFVYVDDDAVGGDGSIDRPYASIDLAIADGHRRLSVAPGQYSTASPIEASTEIVAHCARVDLPLVGGEAVVNGRFELRHGFVTAPLTVLGEVQLSNVRATAPIQVLGGHLSFAGLAQEAPGALGLEVLQGGTATGAGLSIRRVDRAIRVGLGGALMADRITIEEMNFGFLIDSGGTAEISGLVAVGSGTNDLFSIEAGSATVAAAHVRGAIGTVASLTLGASLVMEDVVVSAPSMTDSPVSFNTNGSHLRLTRAAVETPGLRSFGLMVRGGGRVELADVRFAGVDETREAWLLVEPGGDAVVTRADVVGYGRGVSVLPDASATITDLSATGLRDKETDDKEDRGGAGIRGACVERLVLERVALRTFHRDALEMTIQRGEGDEERCTVSQSSPRSVTAEDLTVEDCGNQALKLEGGVAHAFSRIVLQCDMSTTELVNGTTNSSSRFLDARFIARNDGLKFEETSNISAERFSIVAGNVGFSSNVGTRPSLLDGLVQSELLIGLDIGATNPPLVPRAFVRVRVDAPTPLTFDANQP